MARLALRFISGKYKGGEYVVSENKETIIGRSSDIDLVLMEDMVSRKHARLWIKDGKIHLKDLGSTNGSFVNGEKISEIVVNRGDRILIGTSIMKVVETEKEARKTQSRSPLQPQDGSARTTMHSGRSMSGTIREVPLPGLIQLFATSKKTGTLVITKKNRVAKIHLDKGKLVYASISDSPDLKPLKAMFRILTWDDGNFELVGPEAKSFPEIIDMPTEHLLIEGLRQLDEIRHMQKKLPPMEAELVVVTPLMSRLADLNDNELDIFQLVYNYGTVGEVLDRAPSDDADSATTLINLISRKYVAQV
ncbi:MAG: DUF4388 domain-containing protein [Deltaproteobacteria bacterium]|nr:DUF4388 domain-containing protein [Deltaproteobacteria bacterium]